MVVILFTWGGSAAIFAVGESLSLALSVSVDLPHTQTHCTETEVLVNPMNENPMCGTSQDQTSKVVGLLSLSAVSGSSVS